jgi:hypothetical protein
MERGRSSPFPFQGTVLETGVTFVGCGCDWGCWESVSAEETPQTCSLHAAVEFYTHAQWRWLVHTG